MKLHDLFEGIPMKPSVFKNFKHSYTVGYEFEMRCTGKGEPMSGQGLYDLRSSFDNNWNGSTEQNEFFNNFFANLFAGRERGGISSVSDLVDKMDYNPKYGTTSVEKYLESRKKVYIDTSGQEKYDMIYKYKDIDPYEDEDKFQEFVDAFFYDKQDLSKHLTYSRLLQFFVNTLRDAGLENPYPKSYFILNKYGSPMAADSIKDLDAFVQLYDVTRQQVIQDTQDLWEDLEDDAREIAFDNWLEDQNLGDAEALGYVAERLEEMGYDVGTGSNYFNVVPDNTPGVDAEITTPIADHQTAIQYMKEICELIREDDELSTSKQCGVHINIGTFNPDEIDWLKFLVIYDDRLALNEFGRQNNRFAISQLLNLLTQSQSDAPAYKNAIATTNKIIFDNANKYTAVNFLKLKLSKPHIEIRAPGGEGYEDKVDKIEWYTLRAIRALEIARDPNAYRAEYIRLIQRITGDQKVKPYPPKELFKQLGLSYNRSMPSDGISGIISMYTPELAMQLRKKMNKQIIDLIVQDFNYEPGEKDYLKQSLSSMKNLPDFQERISHPFLKILLRRLNITDL